MDKSNQVDHRPLRLPAGFSIEGPSPLDDEGSRPLSNAARRAACVLSDGRRLKRGQRASRHKPRNGEVLLEDLGEDLLETVLTTNRLLALTT